MNSRAVVLLSGGLDSSFNFFKALEELEVILALTVDYGQRAAPQEIATAARLAGLKSVPHRVVDLPWFREFTSTALVADQIQVPVGSALNIDSMEKSQASAKAVWVPNRNGILVNLAAGYAEGLGADRVIVGFNREEAETFPDNSVDFIESLNDCLHFSTANHVKVQCYSHHLDKTEIVRDALKVQLPFKDLWPCYKAGDAWCGECESCQRFSRAIKAAGVTL